MSLLINDQISDILLETQTVGNRVSNDDIILAYKRANEYFNSNYKMPTTERQQNLKIYNGVFEYPKADDFIGWFEPMRPYGNTSPWFVNTTENELVHTYAGNQTAFKFDRENQFLIVSYENGDSTSINNCDSLDSQSNGTVTVSGDGSGLVLDQQIFVEGSASYRFYITPSTGTTTITISGMPAVDLSQYFNAGNIFLNLDCPNSNTSAISSVRLRIGSDNTGTTDYYEYTSTTWYRGDSIKNGFNQIGFETTGISPVGSPTTTSLTYIQIVISNGTTSATQGFYRLDNIFASLATYFQLPYYSKYNIKTEAGEYILAPTQTSDTVLCPDDCNAAFTFKALEHIALYNLRDQGRAQYFAGLLFPFENTLRSKYPSQERKVQSQYYRSSTPF